MALEQAPLNEHQFTLIVNAVVIFLIGILVYSSIAQEESILTTIFLVLLGMAIYAVILIPWYGDNGDHNIKKKEWYLRIIKATGTYAICFFLYFSMFT